MAVPLNNPVAVLWLGHLCFNFSAGSYLRECCRPDSLRKQTLRQEMYLGCALGSETGGRGKEVGLGELQCSHRKRSQPICYLYAFVVYMVSVIFKTSDHARD